ncbi:MAG: hypothetical protein V2A66_07285 [Pseudomonadota bacterium]
MPFELSHFNVMEHLWETLEKTVDGRIRYHWADVEQLWELGFVDTERYNREAWVAVFEPYRQGDGFYLLGHDDFIALDEYRYKGEVRIPFEAMEINEGRYTDEGLDDLIFASIAPSCSIAPDKLKEFFDTLKKDFRQDDGLILVRRPAKERIKTLLEKNPSPLRNLEIMLDHMLREKGADMEKGISEAQVDAATAKAALQASHFSSEPTSRVEAKARGLKQIEKARGGSTAPAELKGVAKVELKNIRRSRKGMRG